VTDPRSRLIQILKDKSYRKRKVILASGRESDFYVDGRQTTLNAEGALLLGRIIYESLLLDDPPVDAIAGMTLGADPICTAVSVVSALEGRPIHALLVRKESKKHGTGNQIEGLGNVPAGSRVAVVEDTSTTGGSVLKAVKAAEAAGMEVTRVITLVDRQEGAAENVKENGYTLEALVTREELVD
jgi:orotate phosphoribosyltransferase